VKLDLANPAWRQTLPPARSIAADAPAAACAFSRDGATVAFALGDGSVRLLPADIATAAPDAASPVHGGAVLALVGDPAGDGFVSGGDDGRLLRIGPDGTATELANYKGKWVEHLAAHRTTGAVAASVGKSAIVVKDGEVREFGPHQSTVADLDFSKDGSRIACAHYGGVTVWSLGQVALPARHLAWRGNHAALRWST
jgi:WD40 repeat protein